MKLIQFHFLVGHYTFLNYRLQIWEKRKQSHASEHVGLCWLLQSGFWAFVAVASPDCRFFQEMQESLIGLGHFAELTGELGKQVSEGENRSQ